jgi:hypothetical protein
MPAQFQFRGIPLSAESEQAAAGAAGTKSFVVVPATLPGSVRNPWMVLPAPIAVLVASPETVAAIGTNTPHKRDAIWQALAEACLDGDVSIETEFQATAVKVELPSLKAERRLHPGGWFLDHVARLPEKMGLRPSTEATALQAGILQMADFFDASHEASQSIEGEGRHRHGDYWHGINHRREPDYGNARYWFRRVGNHPVFECLAIDIQPTLDWASESEATQLAALIRDGRFDPLRFIDLIEAGLQSRSRASVALLEWIQWTEMVDLLTSTWDDAQAAE